MLDGLTSRLTTGVVTVVAALGLLLAVPGQPQPAVAECGEYNGNKCKEQQDCVVILFYSSCTTDYYYYQESMQ